MHKPRKELIWLQHINLIWLLGLLWGPLLDSGFGWKNWLVTLASLLVFFWRYSLGHRGGPHPQSQRLTTIGVWALLGVVVAAFNPWSSVYIVFAAGSSGYLQPTTLAQRLVGYTVVAVGLYALLLAWAGAPPVIALSLFAMMGLLTLGIGYGSLRQSEQNRFNHQIQAAQEENKRLATIAERERIARDLHDLLGHTLAVITLKAELASKLLERDPAKAKAEMLEVERISREATLQVRQAVQGYKSKGLQGELAGAKLAFESAGIQFDYYAEPVELAPMQEGVLSISLREAVTNVLRHSGATHCAIRLHKEGQEVWLEVEDNGKGGSAEAGSGLTGMRQRLEALGGSLETNGESGFRLSVRLPSSSSGALVMGELKPQTN